MKRIIDVPGTGCTEFPTRIREYFGEPDETWNVHLSGTAEKPLALPFPESVKLLSQRIADSVSKKLILRWHSLGARAIIHAIIKNPELLRKIHHLDIICSPAEMVSHGEFFTANIHRLALFMSRRFPFLFDPLFLESLKTDTEETNQTFIQTLKRHQFKNPIRAYFNLEDPFLSKVDEEYGFRIQNFLHENTGLNLHIHRIEYWHNYEGYKRPPE